jgi:hypothetical protein
MHLESLKQLTELTLMSGDITDAGMPSVAHLIQLTSLSLAFTSVTDAGLVSLQDLVQLQSLTLPSKVTDAGLKNLRPLKQLRSLEFTNALGFTGAGLEHLAGAPNLASLDLYTTGVSGENLRFLAHLPRLTNLSTAQTAMTDEGMVHIGLLENLIELRVSNTSVSDTGFAHLSRLSNLSSLDASENLRLSDAGIMHLGGLRKLRRLSINSNNVTDASVGTLKQLTGLGTLSVDRTLISPDGFSQLKAALPSTEIQGELLPIADQHVQAVLKMARLGAKIETYPHREDDQLFARTSVTLDENWMGKADDFRDLAKLTGLHFLIILAPVDEADLVHVKGLATITMVLARHPFVSEEHLEFLTSLPNLEWVRLEGPFTDRAVDSLSQLKQARILALIDSKLSQAAIEKLNAALPNTSVLCRASGE